MNKGLVSLLVSLHVIALMLVTPLTVHGQLPERTAPENAQPIQPLERQKPAPTKIKETRTRAKPQKNNESIQKVPNRRVRPEKKSRIPIKSERELNIEKIVVK